MFVIEDVRTSLETTSAVAELVRTSIGKSYITIATNRGPVDVQLEGLTTKFMATGTSREGLHVAVLLASDETDDTSHSTIILSKKLPD